MGTYEENKVKFEEAKEMLDSGRDIETGRKMLKELADEGYAPAQGRYAFFLLEMQKIVESFELAMKGANNGDSNAQHLLGRFYDCGISDYLEKDVNKAVYWLEKSSEDGVIQAMKLLADICLLRQYDITKGYYWGLKAAESGEADWQVRIGLVHLDGAFGLQKDFEKAKYWIEKSVAQGFEGSYPVIADIYQMEGNVEKAKYYWEKAVESEGCSDSERGISAYNLSLMFKKEQNTQKSEEWLRKSAEFGFEKAKQLVDGANANINVNANVNENASPVTNTSNRSHVKETAESILIKVSGTGVYDRCEPTLIRKWLKIYQRMADKLDEGEEVVFGTTGTIFFGAISSTVFPGIIFTNKNRVLYARIINPGLFDKLIGPKSCDIGIIQRIVTEPAPTNRKLRSIKIYGNNKQFCRLNDSPENIDITLNKMLSAFEAYGWLNGITVEHH